MSDQSKSGSFVEYKGIRIEKGTDAFELFVSNKLGQLDEHLKQLQIKNEKLMELK